MEYLFIDRGDTAPLPNEFHLAHNLTVRYYDDMVELLQNDEIIKKSEAEMDVSGIVEEKDIKNPEFLLIDYLEEHGHKKKAQKIISHHLFHGLLSDMCHFIYQSIFCAKRLAPTVALTLLRKPFLENLLILEQLLIDEDEFLLKFNENSEMFDPMSLKRDEKKSIVKEAHEKLSDYDLDYTLNYQIRYNPKNSKSLYAMTNAANHLVTNRYEANRTESLNLNYIFSGRPEWNSQLDYFYFYTPYFLHYTIEIIDSYLLNKGIMSHKFFKKRRAIRIFRLAVINMEKHGNQKTLNKTKKVLEKIKVRCEECKKENRIYLSDIYSMVHDNYVVCKNCLIDMLNDSDSFDPLFEKFEEF